MLIRTSKLDLRVKQFSQQPNKFKKKFIDSNHLFLNIQVLGSNFIQFIQIDFHQSDNFQEKWHKKFYLMPSETDQHSTDTARKSISLLTSYFKKYGILFCIDL